MPDGDVACRKVRQHGCSGERGICAGRNRCPKIFADFDVDRKIIIIRRVENQVVAEGHELPEKGDFAFDRVSSGVELPIFI